jgi:hypothetical protein
MLTKTAHVISALLLVAALAGCASTTETSGPVATVPSTSSPVVPMPSTTVPSADPKQTDVFAVKVGDCLNDVDGMLISDVPLVDCAAPHDLEVFDEFTVTDPSWNPVTLDDEANDGCTERFATFIGIAYDDSELDVTSYKPTATSWATGDRLISCMVGDSSTQTTGTLRGAAR